MAQDQAATEDPGTTTATPDNSTPPLKVWFNNWEWVVAETPFQASALARQEHAGLADEEDREPTAWRALPDDKELGMDCDDGKPPVRKTCRKWCEEAGEPGYLGATDW